jgi:cobalt transporter subunit CbtA
VLKTLLAAALIAGLAGGVLASVLQLARLVPLIEQAEVYENSAGPAAHADANTPAAGAAIHDHAAHAHEWEPEGLQRPLLTVLANAAIGVGFACMLVAGLALRAMLSKQPITVRAGLLWGLAGFAVFSLAPALGLPPELPGGPESPLLPRQVWWLGTTISTAAGLACVAFGRGIWPRLLGVGLLALPHVIGAPQVVGTGVVPEALTSQFIWLSIASAAVFWLLLGGLSGWLLPRLGFSPRLA